MIDLSILMGLVSALSEIFALFALVVALALAARWLMK